MLIKNLYNLFCGSESQDGRLVCATDVIDKNTQVINNISDCIGDTDTNLMSCILRHVSDPNKMSGHLFVDDLMAAAGYVSGERYILGNPRVLHKDFDPMNFDSNNLEWVEAIDPRYIEYQKKVDEWKHQRNMEFHHRYMTYPSYTKKTTNFLVVFSSGATSTENYLH